MTMKGIEYEIGKMKKMKRRRRSSSNICNKLELFVSHNSLLNDDI
jgi:hypothetical protein